MDESFTEQNLPQILISKQFLSTERPDETLTINRNYDIQKLKDQNKKTQPDSENLTSSTLNSPLQNKKLNEQNQDDKNQENTNQQQSKNQGFQGFKKCKKGTQNSENHQTCQMDKQQNILNNESVINQNQITKDRISIQNQDQMSVNINDQENLQIQQYIQFLQYQNNVLNNNGVLMQTYNQFDSENCLQNNQNLNKNINLQCLQKQQNFSNLSNLHQNNILNCSFPIQDNLKCIGNLSDFQFTNVINNTQYNQQQQEQNDKNIQVNQVSNFFTDNYQPQSIGQFNLNQINNLNIYQQNTQQLPFQYFGDEQQNISIQQLQEQFLMGEGNKQRNFMPLLTENQVQLAQVPNLPHQYTNQGGTQILCENQESCDNNTFSKQKISQENGSKKQKQTLNTSHVPINMMNNLVTHLIKIYTSQIKCKCIKFSNECQSRQQPLVKEEEKQEQCINKHNTQIEVDINETKIKNENFESERQQSDDLLSQKNLNQKTNRDNSNNKFNNNNDNNINICRRCKELQIISSMKKSKIKNIRSFQKLWQNMRIRVLSENYLTSFATYQILNKKYRSANNRKALYECLTAFLSGTRNPDKFWKLI